MNELHDPRLSDLYRRTPQQEPRGESDRVVLDAAHRAVSGRQGFAVRGWALAATLVLGVGLGWQLLSGPPGVAPVSPQPAALSVPAPADQVEAVERAKTGAASTPSAAMKRRQSAADMELAPADPVVQYGASIDAADGQLKEEVGKSKTRPCNEFWLVDERSREAWLAAIAGALDAGETHRAACLQTRYQQLFSRSQR
jgi:hypothetical protein